MEKESVQLKFKGNRISSVSSPRQQFDQINQKPAITSTTKPSVFSSQKEKEITKISDRLLLSTNWLQDQKTRRDFNIKVEDAFSRKRKAKPILHQG